MTHDTEIAIVGAGLSGLALAHALKAEGRAVTVLEARDRVGGRVLSQDGYDLGPAWIWPHNRRMLALADRFGLTLFEQHCDGNLVFEDPEGLIRRDLAFSAMGGALRVSGGLARVTDALARDLGDIVRTDHVVRSVSEEASGVLLAGDRFSLSAQRVVLALPPRLASGLGLSVPDIPTWMAGYAKLVAIYDTPFWRQAGLNGDAVSHRGPLTEVHDASPMDARTGALFGFTYGDAARTPEFRAQALAQLGRMFGAQAANPREVLFKDWASDAATATPADRVPPADHPHYRALAPTRRLIFAGSETAVGDGGFLEGALEAAALAQRQLATVTA